MNDARPARKSESARRIRAWRRVAPGIVANYIHELSDRHGRKEARAVRAPAR